MEHSGGFHEALSNIGLTSGQTEKGIPQVIQVSAPFIFNIQQPTDTFGPMYDCEEILRQQLGSDDLDQLLQAVGTDVQDGLLPLDDARMKPRDLTELGEGYLNDSFVDDQGPESMIPAGFTTEHGGHYIGSGQLQIRRVLPGEIITHNWTSGNTEEFVLSGPDTLRYLQERFPDVPGSPYALPKDCLRDFKAKKPTKGEKRAAPARTTVERTISPEIAEPKPKRGRPSLGTALATANSRVTSAFETTTEKASESHAEDVQQENSDRRAASAALPLGLPDSLVEDIGKLQALAQGWTGNKQTFLKNADVQAALLGVEFASMLLSPNSQRSKVYDYLAGFMMCTKKTLLERSRKLRKDDVDKRSDDMVKELLQCLVHKDGSAQKKIQARKLAEQTIQLKLLAADLYKTADRKSGTKQEYLANWFASETWMTIKRQTRFDSFGIAAALQSSLSPA